MKGKWAKGIAPRFFAWIIKDQLAVSERPGGYARNHRRVRRQEEILWLRGEGFTRVVSLLTSPHNLHAYDELNMAWAQVPFGPQDDPSVVLPDLYAQLRDWMASGERLLLHQEELSDRLMGVVAGYLRWSGLVPEGPQAITVVERIMHRQMGPDGRVLVALAPQLSGAGRCGGPATVKARMSEDEPPRREPAPPKREETDADLVAYDAETTPNSVGPATDTGEAEPAPAPAPEPDPEPEPEPDP
ncbi:MAG: hypothetical protein QOE15_1097, partial [Acidimicrobiaceae bacterium]|nr:hypothetical protein [Acidimicrobiaceae bacterium]